MLIGSLFIQVNAARLDGYRIEDRLNPILHKGIRIWPIERDTFDWSKARKLSAENVLHLGVSMDLLMAHPNTKWGGMDIPR